MTRNTKVAPATFLKAVLEFSKACGYVLAHEYVQGEVQFVLYKRDVEPIETDKSYDDALLQARLDI